MVVPVESVVAAPSGADFVAASTLLMNALTARVALILPAIRDLIERKRVEEADGVKAGDRVSVLAELFMSTVKALVDEDIYSPGTYDTYRYNVDKNILPRIGEIRLNEATTPRVNTVITKIRDEVGVEPDGPEM